MKLKKVVHLYFKKFGKHTLEIMKKIPGNLPKKLEISWNFVRSEKWEPWIVM